MDHETNSSVNLEEVICEINMKLPSLNEYINACRRNRYEASKMKKDLDYGIGLFLAEIPHFARPVHIDFEWYENNRRRDLDNVCFAKKFILDALVKAGCLDDDNSKHVIGFTDTFHFGEEAKVVLHIKEVDDGKQTTR